MFDGEDQETTYVNNDYLDPKERKIVDSFNPRHLTSGVFQEDVRDGILATEGIQIDNDDNLRMERKRLGAMAVTMIQKMDDAFDNSRHSFKVDDELPDSAGLLPKLMAIKTQMGGEEVTVGELLTVIEKARHNENLYPNAASRDLIAGDLNYLQTEVVDTVSGIEKKPSEVTFEEALELRRVTNRGDAALMFDLSYADLADNPAYGNARERTLDMAVATSLNDDFTDFIEDMQGEKVNSFLAAARDTGEYDALAAVFRTKGFKRQMKRGEVDISEAETAKKMAPNAYKKLSDAQKPYIDSVKSEMFTLLYSLSPAQK